MQDGDSQRRSPKASIAFTPRRVRSLAMACTSIRPIPPPVNSLTRCAVMNSTASALTGLVGKAIERGTYCGGANSMYPAGTPSTYAIFPQLPNSRRTEDTHDSFSSSGTPLSSARAPLTGPSSQKTHLRHLGGKSPRLSSVILTIRRDILFPGRPIPAEPLSVPTRYPLSWHDTGPLQAPTSGEAVTGDEQPASQRQRIDPYVGQYAERAVSMVASEIRALFAVAPRPEIVSLAGGSPYVSALPLDAVGEMIGQLIAGRGDTALQYCTAQGDAGLRERICDVMALEEIRAHPDEIVVTVGSQQALDLLTRIFIDPGDVILAEAPSYVGALGAFASYQARVVHVAMDDDGLIPEALTEAIARTAAAGRRAKFLYTVPNFHNPAGVTLAAARRPRILDICQRAGLLVVEDNPYGLLGFDGDPMRALRADDGDGVVYLGTFSKTSPAGVRVGWAVAPAGIRDKLILAAESAVLCHSSFAQLTVRYYLATQPWLEQVKTFRELYRERRDATLSALDTMMPPGCHWTRPAGGFYVWLGLPDGVHAKAMLPRAISSRVAYVPGTGFYADGSGGQYARLCYSLPSPDRIREGIRRLASVIETEIELRDDFGPAPGTR